MASHTSLPITLKHSRPVIWTGKHKKLDYRTFNKRRIKGEGVLQKSIHSYRLWFLFLKLGLELEQQNTELVLKFPQTRKVGRKPLQPAIKKMVRVNKGMYKGWDLDEVLDQSFDTWWVKHKHLFEVELYKVLDWKYEHYDWGRDRVSPDRKHLTIQLDTTQRVSDLLDIVKRKIREKKRENKGLPSKKKRVYSINGNINTNSLMNRYNCLVLKLENELTNEEILEPNKGEPKYIRGLYTIRENQDGNMVYSRPIHSLLIGGDKTFGAKQILLSVCDGYFLKHPTKTYL